MCEYEQKEMAYRIRAIYARESDKWHEHLPGTIASSIEKGAVQIHVKREEKEPSREKGKKCRVNNLGHFMIHALVVDRRFLGLRFSSEQTNTKMP